jgi:type 1 glutamine amidotransferase
MVWALGLGLHSHAANVEAIEPLSALSFKPAAAAGEFTFDTGILRGTLRPGGKTLGLSGVVHVPTGRVLDRGNGLFGHYRVFTRNHRFGNGAWDWPSTARRLEDGAVEVTWAAAEERPFEMTATFRWFNRRTLDLVTVVKARQDLPGFEVFLASYFQEAFTNALVYVQPSAGAGTEPRFLAADAALGDWLMSPRSSDLVALIRDGRWKIEPNPVDWVILPPLAAPIGLRHDPVGGLTVVLMAMPQDCYALASPQETEGHYSLYQSLHGRDLKAGDTAVLRSRLFVGAKLGFEQAVHQYQKFVLANVASPAPASRRPCRILLVTGQEYPGHPWRQTAPALAEGLRQEPRLQVTVMEDPHLLDSEALGYYDAVLLHFMNWEQPAPGLKARENLRRFVEAGGGLGLVHFACGAWQDWPEFRNLAGRSWDPQLRGHDPRGSFLVEIVDRGHFVTRGLQDFEADDELYTCLAGERPIRVLAKAKSKVDGKDYPMAFVFEYGQGRVFHCVLGHDLKAMVNPGAAELYRRGCLWAAGVE